ncbi:MAG: lysoplasmalogenase, partial [Mesorhizobium sp.]
MGISALTLSNFWVVGGAVLFMAYDGLLAAEKFLLSAISPHRAWTRHAVWALYYAAQLGITMGFLLG